MMSIGLIPVLETDRLRLRGFAEDDLAPLAEIFGDPVHAEHIGGALDIEDVWRRMCFFIGHWSLRGYGLFALEAKDSRKFVGFCGLYNPHGWPEPEIGYALHPEFLGRGLITEAARRCIRFAYEDLGWTTLMSLIKPENERSIAVAKRLGARFEKRQKLTKFTADLYRHLPPEKIQQIPITENTH